MLTTLLDQHPAPAAHGGPRRVLIVDDDHEFAESLVDLLTPAGYEATTADKAEAALRTLREHEIEVALIDIRLGGESGVDLLATFRAEHPRVVCVMMTARVDTASAVETMRHGAYDYMDKSSNPAELLAVLNRAGEKHQLLRERHVAVEGLRRAKQMAETANRAKTEFLAVMSHELRTPLNAIIGFAELIRGEPFGPLGNPNYGEYLRDIQDSGERLLGIITDILDISNAESGNLTLDEDEFDLAEAIHAVAGMLHVRLVESRLTLTSDFPAELPRLCGDERKVRQVLLNLLSNAMKFTSAGGAISVTVSVQDSAALTIDIADTGIGLAEADMERVLQPFVQIESAYARHHGGTGLGLPIANAIMQRHGGSLRLANRAGGGGLVATATFPPERLVSVPTAAAAD